MDQIQNKRGRIVNRNNEPQSQNRLLRKRKIEFSEFKQIFESFPSITKHSLHSSSQSEKHDCYDLTEMLSCSPFHRLKIPIRVPARLRKLPDNSLESMPKKRLLSEKIDLFSPIQNDGAKIEVLSSASSITNINNCMSEVGSYNNYISDMEVDNYLPPYSVLDPLNEHTFTEDCPQYCSDLECPFVEKPEILEQKPSFSSFDLSPSSDQEIITNEHLTSLNETYNTLDSCVIKELDEESEQKQTESSENSALDSCNQEESTELLSLSRDPMGDFILTQKFPVYSTLRIQNMSLAYDNFHRQSETILQRNVNIIPSTRRKNSLEEYSCSFQQLENTSGDGYQIFSQEFVHDDALGFGEPKLDFIFPLHENFEQESSDFIFIQQDCRENRDICESFGSSSIASSDEMDMETSISGGIC